ncbi:hypothetical protein [Achromobacter aloeverae]
MEAAGLALLRQHLAAASHYLEYGSGGSTLFAAKAGIKSIISVESDAGFLQAVQKAFEERISDKMPFLPLHADIGPTGAWGSPTTNARMAQWPRYCAMPWEEIRDANLPKPGLILVDGRFRRASFLISLLMADPGAVILWDDYADRPHYHDVEVLIKPRLCSGRMAEFVVPEDRDTAGILLKLVQAVTDTR